MAEITKALIEGAASGVGGTTVAIVTSQLRRIFGRNVVKAAKASEGDRVGLLATIREGAVGLCAVSLLGRIHRKMDEYGIDPEDVSPKMFFTLFESGAQESDETLQEMWAQLIVEGTRGSNTPVLYYRSLLEQLDPIGARVLKRLCEITAFGYDLSTSEWTAASQPVHLELKASRDDVDAVVRQMDSMGAVSVQSYGSGEPHTARPTAAGRGLIRACSGDAD